MSGYWDIPTLYECIAHIDKEYIECSLSEDEEYPDNNAILEMMRDRVAVYAIVNPFDKMEEYQIPGRCEATDGKHDLYRDGDEYYLVQMIE